MLKVSSLVVQVQQLTKCMSKPRLLKLSIGLWLLLSFILGLLPAKVVASGFSGSDISNYRCPSLEGYEQPAVTVQNSNFVCIYIASDGTGRVTRNAIPNPPTLEIAQIWFVRIIYVIWAFSGLAFTAILMWLGFQYLTSFGNEVALADVVKKFRYWLIGIALVFLSYPALNTFFRILPINQTQCFADIQLPAFRFFFPTACQP